MTINQQNDRIEDGVMACLERNCQACPYHYNYCEQMRSDFQKYFSQLKRTKETLRKILSALYKEAGNPINITRFEIIKLAKMCGFVEQELK